MPSDADADDADDIGNLIARIGLLYEWPTNCLPPPLSRREIVLGDVVSPHVSGLVLAALRAEVASEIVLNAGAFPYDERWRPALVQMLREGIVAKAALRNIDFEAEMESHRARKPAFSAE